MVGTARDAASKQERWWRKCSTLSLALPSPEGDSHWQTQETGHPRRCSPQHPGAQVGQGQCMETASQSLFCPNTMICILLWARPGDTGLRPSAPPKTLIIQKSVPELPRPQAQEKASPPLASMARVLHLLPSIAIKPLDSHFLLIYKVLAERTIKATQHLADPADR